MTEIPAQSADPTGGIPQSAALTEAETDSIAELMSRDPESYQAQDLVKLIEYYRAKRLVWAAGEVEKQSKPKAVKGASKAASLISIAKAGELDL